MLKIRKKNQLSIFSSHFFLRLILFQLIHLHIFLNRLLINNEKAKNSKLNIFI